MELIRPSLKKVKSTERKDWRASVPMSLTLFPDCSIQKLKSVDDFGLNEIQLEQSFNQTLMAIFILKGEMNGWAICQLENDDEVSDEFETTLIDFFLESMNITIGNFLTNLAEESGIFSELMAPIVYRPHDRSDKNESFRKKRVLGLITPYLERGDIHRVKFLLTSSERTFPVTITFILEMKKVHQGG